MGLIWTKILIAVRGHATETADAIMSRQALRILDHEAHEAEDQVGVGRSSLANLMAKNILAAREVEQTAGRLTQLTGEAEQALVLQDNERALDVAARIGRLELILAEDTRISQQYASNVDILRTALQSSEDTLSSLKQQINVLRTVDAAHRSAAAHRDLHARLQAVADSLDAIRLCQQEVAARLQAQDELCARDQQLEKRLREALVIADDYCAHAVLARIRATQSCEPAMSD